MRNNIKQIWTGTGRGMRTIKDIVDGLTTHTDRFFDLDIGFVLTFDYDNMRPADQERREFVLMKEKHQPFEESKR